MTDLSDAEVWDGREPDLDEIKASNCEDSARSRSTCNLWPYGEILRGYVNCSTYLTAIRVDNFITFEPEYSK